MGGLVPAEGDRPKFAQLYIHDTQNEVQNRMNFFPTDPEANPLREDIVQGLKEMLDNNNILVQTFRSARDRIMDRDLEQVHVKLCARRIGDGREYELPTGNEIAALIVDDAGQNSFEPDIIVQQQSSELQRISLYHPSLMALQYPILFPFGEDGWHPNIEQCPELDEDNEKEPKMVSQCDYYSYRLQTRFDQSNSLLLAGKLLQQYVVNAYALVEAERLDWIRNNQSKLRRHYYSGLVDSFLRGDTDLKLTGQHIILASTHTGSPRYKYENFQDAMAICRWTGYPDLFITFTCNANWPEIQFMVDIIKANGRKDYNRADVIARVFRLKLLQLMLEIRDKQIFGKTSGYVHAIEFQKRGLPHAHILVFLAAEDKPATPTEIDSIISAEIPDQNLDPEGYNAVTSFMIHGPCGPSSPNAQCMKNGICTKHFPKQFCTQTTIDENGFAKYRRQDTGTVTVNRTEVDNRYVVPYNRYLLLRFGAHINVEFCNRSRAIKYLFKYINKPADRATSTLVGNQISNTNTQVSDSSAGARHIDEVKAFLDCRYVTAREAC
ncbi:unnamed protein product [Linum trigynum]|uniref:Helitron helicase-like domain-containing protein n=1 Tax=Linum trigynum TaxID=586398 RepID=A0AAV2E1J8_9ROSI